MNTEAETRKAHAGIARFCWLRETGPGQIDADGGVRIAVGDLLPALLGLHRAQRPGSAEPGVSVEQALAGMRGATKYEDIPQWARRRLAGILGPLQTPAMRAAAGPGLATLERLARRIAAVIPSSAPGEIEIHLPYIDRRAWSNRFELLDSTNFVLNDGRIIPDSLLDQEKWDVYNAQLVAAASANPGFDVAHRYAAGGSVPPALLGSLLPVNAALPPSPGASRVRILIELDRFACRAWNAAPRERSGAYFKVHSKVSMAIQSALRRWLAWHWCSNPAHFAGVLSMCTALVYLNAAPAPGKRRTDFSFDLMNNDWMDYAFRRARIRLKAVLAGVSHTQRALGDPALARYFHPERAPDILNRVRRERRAIRSLIAAEANIVNQILRLGLDLHNAGPMQAVRAVPGFMKGLNVRLRRLFHEQDLAYLGVMLLFVATDALHQALGGQPSLKFSVTLLPGAAIVPDPATMPVQLVPRESLAGPLPC